MAGPRRPSTGGSLWPAYTVGSVVHSFTGVIDPHCARPCVCSRREHSSGREGPGNRPVQQIAITKGLCVAGSQKGVLEGAIPELSLQGWLRVSQLVRGSMCGAKETAGAKARSSESHVELVAGVRAAHSGYAWW